MSVSEFRKDYERPVWVNDKPGFKRCWKCTSRNLVEPATDEQAAYLKVPVGVGLCLDCALEVPEGWTPDAETAEKIERSKTVVIDSYGEDKVVTLEEDERRAFRQNQYKWDSEENGVWK